MTAVKYKSLRSRGLN